jgi:putative methyltransferase
LTTPPEKCLEHHQPPMSLYYEAASVLANTSNAGGSLKSRIYNNKELKTTPAQLFALISEASKWSLVLKGVVERCGVLGAEKKVSMNLALTKIRILKSPVAHANNCPTPHTRSRSIERRRRCTGRPRTEARYTPTQGQAERRVHQGTDPPRTCNFGSIQKGCK